MKKLTKITLLAATLPLVSLPFIHAAALPTAGTPATADNSTPAVAAKHPRLHALMLRRQITRHRVAKRLGLSADQIAQLKAERTKTDAAVKGIRSDASLTPEQKKAKVHETLRSARTETRGVLTPEQQAKLEAFSGSTITAANNPRRRASRFRKIAACTRLSGPGCGFSFSDDAWFDKFTSAVEREPVAAGKVRAPKGCSLLPLPTVILHMIITPKSAVRLTFFAAFVAAGVALWAADKPEARAPLKLQTDAKPINRDAAERVSYSSVVKKTAPSVVYVFTSKKVRAQRGNSVFDDPALRRYFGIPDDDSDSNPGPGSGSNPGSGKRNRNRDRARPPEQVQTGLGSGIIVTADGYILTNNHVVEDADEVKVAFGEPRKEFKATVIGRDSKADVAVIKIDATGLPVATLGDSDKLEIGDVVLAIGNPFGVGQSVSRGIVSALSRGGFGIETYEDFIQTDAAINPGNSGGALFDSDGRVVGINTAILSRTGGSNGIGFAIPINQARGLAEQLVTKGKVERAYLGVSTQDLDNELSSLLKVTQGALINEVNDGTPADKAGLKNGDVITKIDGSDIKDSRQLQLMITRLMPGSDVKITYVRNDQPATATAKLGTLKDNLLAGDDRGAGGKSDGVLDDVAIGELTPDLRQQMNVPKRIEGVLVTNVEPDGPSARAGLREGDVILSLNSKTAGNVEDAVKLSEEIKGPKVLVQFWRSGRSRTVVVDETEK